MKSLRAFAVAVAVVASFVPALAMAQVYTTNNCTNTWNQWGTTNCSTGNLIVFVQVNNNNGTPSRSANDFAVTVNSTGTNTYSFQGSLNGTTVAVGGNYSVTTSQQPGFTATYSAGCNGTMINNTQNTCTVTETNNVPYTTYPSNYYPYNYNYAQPLRCELSNQTVLLGQSVTFTAIGGDSSQYIWSNSDALNSVNYNSGRTYTTTFRTIGTGNVTVSNGTQNANCSVNVVGGYTNGYNYNYPGSYPTVTVTPTYIPRLPNTGFEPMSAAGLTFVLAFLLAAALVSYRYVRQLFAIVIR